MNPGEYSFEDLRYLGGCLRKHAPSDFEALGEYVPKWISKFEVGEFSKEGTRGTAIYREFVPNTCTIFALLDEMLHVFEQDHKKVSALVTVEPETMKIFESSRSG